MANGKKEALEEGLLMLGEAYKALKGGVGGEAIAKEAREIRVLANTGRLAEAEVRLARALEFASELRGPMARAAEEVSARALPEAEAALPEVARVAPAAHKPLTIERGWFRDTDDFGPVLVSLIRIWGIPVHRIVRARAQWGDFVARLRAVVPDEIAKFLKGKQKIHLSLTGPKGVGYDTATTEAGAIAAAERMTAKAVQKGKPPTLRFEEGGLTGTIVPGPGTRFTVDVRSTPGSPPIPPTHGVVSTYNAAVEFVRRLLYGAR